MGDGMNEKDRRYILRMSKKIKAIDFLGGKCSYCGDTNIFHLVFHHKNNYEKEIIISQALAMKWSVIENEIKKCVLLCCNCHQELHSKDSLVKKELLSLKGENKCSVCNYAGKNNSSLSFHHEKEKDFWISTKCNYNRNEFGVPIEKLLGEMKKCIVVCENCHRDIHSDISRFEQYKKNIFDKINDYKEKAEYRSLIPKEKDKRKKCDENLCLKLREDGKSLSEIKNISGYSLSSIEKIFSKNSIKGRLETPDEDVKKMKDLFLDGASVKEICEKTGYKEPTVYKYLRKEKEVIKKGKKKTIKAMRFRKKLLVIMKTEILCLLFVENLIIQEFKYIGF